MKQQCNKKAFVLNVNILSSVLSMYDWKADRETLVPFKPAMMATYAETR